MYNSVTQELINNVPEIDGINSSELSQYLTRVFAKIISLRDKVNRNLSIMSDEIVQLRKLANNLELMTALQKEPDHRTSCAFVAATAHHLLHQIRSREQQDLNVDQVPSIISSMVMFLIAGSPADASEVASGAIVIEGENIKDYLFKAIIDLAKGRIGFIRTSVAPQREYTDELWETEAQDYLWSLLFKGLQQLADSLLGFSFGKETYFGKAKDLSILSASGNELNEIHCYPGTYHLAVLLELLEDKLLKTGIINVPNPINIDNEEWLGFLKRLAVTRPYLWANHFDAIATGFLDKGKSAVLAFPTGAGKTTVSELKIASAVMGGSSVLYLVPTHALEDQVKRDLGRLFENIGGDGMEFGAEFTEADESLAIINVMTPERCLTLLSTKPEEFHHLGLIVFDEFHLISGKVDRADQRSLDAMFCLLRLFSEIPGTDYMLISAMVENSEEIAAWVSSVTGRECLAFNSKWKPTRQLQACVVFPKRQINYLEEQIFKYRTEAERPVPTNRGFLAGIKAHAYQLFSLENVWNPNKVQEFYMGRLLNNQLPLVVNPQWRLTSNRNKVAASLAAGFVRQGIKTIVFVDNPTFTNSTAIELASQLGPRRIDTESFQAINAFKIDALKTELGDIKHSYFHLEQQVAVHHGLLMPVERLLNEASFKKIDGLHALVATATLAQGINLPAEVVIIAGDDRFDEDTDNREPLQPHEILNTAGRAGRAGSSAQGIVLLVPGKIITFENKDKAPEEWLDLREKIFSKSDQCLNILDPMSRFLDEVASAKEEGTLTPISENLLLRLHIDQNSSHSAENVFNKSFAYFRADDAAKVNLNAKISKVVQRRENMGLDILYHPWVEAASLKTGIDPVIIDQLSNSLLKLDVDEFLEFSVQHWIGWFLRWINNDVDRLVGMFPTEGSRAQIARALGLPVTTYRLSQLPSKILELEPIIYMYIGGGTYKQIDELIVGRGDDYLKKARRFALRFIPHLSYAIGAMVLILRERYKDEVEFTFLIKQLATMVREGIDTEEKMMFKLSNRSYLRVQCHKMFGS